MTLTANPDLNEIIRHLRQVSEELVTYECPETGTEDPDEIVVCIDSGLTTVDLSHDLKLIADWLEGNKL